MNEIKKYIYITRESRDQMYSTETRPEIHIKEPSEALSDPLFPRLTNHER